MKFQHKKQIAQNVSKIFTQLQMQCVTGIDFLVSKETLFLIISVNCRCPPPGYFWMVPSCRRRDFFVSARRRRKFFTILDDQMHSELTKCRGFSMDLDLEIAKISPTGGLSAIPMIFHSPKSNPWQNNPWQSWYPKSNPWRHGCHGLSNPWRGNYGLWCF